MVEMKSFEEWVKSRRSSKMKIAVFGSKAYDKKYLGEALAAHEKDDHGNDGNNGKSGKSGSGRQTAYEFVFHETSLGPGTLALAAEAEAVCAFVDDDLSAPVLEGLGELGVRAVLLRSAGYNHVDLAAAERLGMLVANVPAYSPEAVAEYAVAQIQTLNRGTHRAYNRAREGNFSLEGLVGRTLRGRTVGVVGTGRIGQAFARIMAAGFGCRLLAHDVCPSDVVRDLGAEYVGLDDLLARSDIISLHCPLVPDTRHLINDKTLSLVKHDAMIVNTSRGGLVDTKAVIRALKAGRLGALALDVYEEEAALFYSDHSGTIVQDDDLMRLMTFPNVVISGHQAFFTEEALHEIASCTLRNLDDYANKRPCPNALVVDKAAKPTPVGI